MSLPKGERLVRGRKVIYKREKHVPRSCEGGGSMMLSRKTGIKLGWLLHRIQEKMEGGCQVIQVQGAEDFLFNLHTRKNGKD